MGYMKDRFFKKETERQTKLAYAIEEMFTPTEWLKKYRAGLVEITQDDTDEVPLFIQEQYLA